MTVIVRVRPLLDDEKYLADGSRAPLAVSIPHTASPNKLRAVAKEGTAYEAVLECAYDQVLPSNTVQADVFESTPIKPAVLGVAQGVSACVFAYGQTSAGKTHTSEEVCYQALKQMAMSPFETNVSPL